MSDFRVLLYRNDISLLRILGNLDQFSSWKTLILDPNVEIIYGEEESFDLTDINSERCSTNGKVALSYQSLYSLTSRYVRPELHYFEDEKVDLSPIDTVWAFALLRSYTA